MAVAQAVEKEEEEEEEHQEKLEVAFQQHSGRD